VALTVTLNGVQYSIPEPNDTGYGAALDTYLKALATAFPPLGGGTASLTAELDLGANFGLKALYLKSETLNPASAGFLRLAKTDSLKWRNNSNGADLALAIDTADALTFNGLNVTGNPMLGANTAAGQSIANGATEAIVVFGTSEVDTDSGYNAGTGRYTIPTGKGGHYVIGAQIAYNTAPTGTCTCSVYKNAALLKKTQFIAPGAGQTIPVSTDLVLAAGDIIDIRTLHGNGAPQNLTATAALNFFFLKRVPT
jgi:hypothetical protein